MSNDFMQTEWTPREGFLPCLSIRQPYAFLIVHGSMQGYGGKTLENRDWTTSYRGPLVIHTGKQVDANAFYGSGRFGAFPSDLEDTSFLDNMPLREDYPLGGIVGIVTLVDVVTHSASPWFVGSYGFVLKDARPIVPLVPIRGYPGLFPVAVSLLPEGVL